MRPVAILLKTYSVLFSCFSPCRSALAGGRGGANALSTVLLVLRAYSPNFSPSTPSFCCLLLILISERLSSLIYFFLSLCVSKFSQLCSFYLEDGGSNISRNVAANESIYAKFSQLCSFYLEDGVSNISRNVAANESIYAVFTTLFILP